MRHEWSAMAKADTYRCRGSGCHGPGRAGTTAVSNGRELGGSLEVTRKRPRCRTLSLTTCLGGIPRGEPTEHLQGSCHGHDATRSTPCAISLTWPPVSYTHLTLP